MTVTPVSVSPFWIARATGAAPRYDGRIEPCRLIPPSRGIDSSSAERIWPYAAVTSKSGASSRMRSSASGALTSSGCTTGIAAAQGRQLDPAGDQLLLATLGPVGLGDERHDLVAGLAQVLEQSGRAKSPVPSMMIRIANLGGHGDAAPSLPGTIESAGIVPSAGRAVGSAAMDGAGHRVEPPDELRHPAGYTPPAWALR